MNKTYFAKKSDLKTKWYLVDAKDKILGRLASKVALTLKGKHKPGYTAHLNTGDGVIVINAALVRVTGRKLKQKVYSRYSGYPGGLRQVKLETMLEKKPATVVRLAVQRMVPGGALGTLMMRKLKVYATDVHPHKSQQPLALEV
jgi:large subunit ribosomal protein L13